MDSASAELGWAWYPTPTSPNQSPSLLIPPPNLSHLSHLLDSTVPGQVHAVALLRHLSNSCSHDLWVTLQLRQCVPNVCVITLLCSCLTPDGFLHMLSGSSLSSFTHSTQSCRSGSSLPSWLTGSIHRKPVSLAPWPRQTPSALPRPRASCSGWGGQCSISKCCALLSAHLAPVNLVELSSLFPGRLPWYYYNRNLL